MCFTVHVANMYKDKLILTYFLLINPTVLWRIARHSAVCLNSEVDSIEAAQLHTANTSLPFRYFKD